MSPVTRISKPMRGKGAEMLFGLSALSTGSRLQDVITTTSIKRRPPNITMLCILPCQIQILYQLRVFVIQPEDCDGFTTIGESHSLSHSILIVAEKTWIHKYPCGFQQLGQIPCIPVIILSNLSSHAMWFSFHLSSFTEAEYIPAKIYRQCSILSHCRQRSHFFFAFTMLVVLTRLLRFFSYSYYSNQSNSHNSTWLRQLDATDSACWSIPTFLNVLVPYECWFSKKFFQENFSFHSQALELSRLPKANQPITGQIGVDVAKIFRAMLVVSELSNFHNISFQEDALQFPE